MNRRLHRLGDQLKAEIADLLLRRVADPRVHDCSIVAVEVSPDLTHALVRVSVLGDEAERQKVVATLKHASGYLRSQLAHRLRHLRKTPELRFRLDRGAEHSQKVSDLLESLHEQDERS